MEGSIGNSTQFLFPLAAAAASATVAALTFLQTDLASRKLLNPTRLHAKRIQEYTYRWSTCFDKARLQVSYYFAGGIQEFENDPSIVDKKYTEYVSKEDDILSLVKRIVDSKKQAGTSTIVTFRPLKIDSDPEDPRGEYYLYLAEEEISDDGKSKSNAPKLYQVPLVPFGRTLQKSFEDQLTTTTLCFVADASSGRASHLLEQLVQESKSEVAVISEPLWMVQLARLIQQRLVSKPNSESLIFALCRLEALRVRHLTKDSRTVLISLPGQSSTPILLPLVQRIFPEDRHVFAYDGCVASVKRALNARKHHGRGSIPSTLDDVCSISNNPIRLSTPFLTSTTSTSSSLAVCLFGLRDALSAIPVSQAEVVETWMSSVDAFFQLKQEENTNGYLPYVFKLSLLSSPNLQFEPQSDSHWSINSLLQYVTGCRSRPLPEGVLDAGKEWLKDFNSSTEPTVPISEENRKAIENCVFKHKSILIGDKTLQDTVLPRQHWTLKQAVKNGCSCCAPEEELEDSEDEEQKSSNDSNPLAVPGAFAMATKTTSVRTKTLGSSNTSKARSKFVDGKLGFAFDPTQFS